MSTIAELDAPEVWSGEQPPAPNTIRARGLLNTWCLLLAASVLLAAMSLPLLVGRVYTKDDLGEFHLPLRAFYAEQLGRGEAFDWMPSLYCGFYLTGEGQLGGYHPWHWLLYRCLPLPVAFDLELLATYPFLLIGSFLWLRRMRLRTDAALWGGLVFAMSGFSLTRFVHPNAMGVIAHIPWMLWAEEVALTEPRGKRRIAAVAAIGLLTASQILLGYPQYVWFSLLAELAVVVCHAERSKPFFKTVQLLVVTKLLGLAIGAVQLLPTVDALAASTRESVDAEFVNSGSMPLLNLVQLFAPYLFVHRVVGQNTHELACYLGAAPTLIILWLVVGLWKKDRAARAARWPLALAGFAILLAMGQDGGLYQLQTWLPVVGRFRFPCRALVLANLAAAVAAAIGWRLLNREQIQTSNKESADSAIGSAPFWCGAVISTAFAITGPWLWSEHVAATWLVALGPMLFAIAALLLTQLNRGHHWAAIGLILLTLIDLGGYGLSYSVWPQSMPLADFVAGAPCPPQSHQGRVVAEVRPGESIRVGNRMLLAGVQRADGYAGLEPARSLDFSKHSHLQLAGVAWVFQSSAPSWQQVDDSDPRFALTTGSPDEEGEAIAVVADRPGTIELTVNAEQPTTLIVRESFHPGWQATIDGRIVPVMRASGNFLSCLVPQGASHVTLSFQPASLRYGKACSLAGLGLLIGLLVVLAWPLVSRHAPSSKSACYE